MRTKLWFKKMFCNHDYHIAIMHGGRTQGVLTSHAYDGAIIICYCPKCHTYFAEFNFKDL